MIYKPWTLKNTYVLNSSVSDVLENFQITCWLLLWPFWPFWHCPSPLMHGGQFRSKKVQKILASFCSIWCAAPIWNLVKIGRAGSSQFFWAQAELPIRAKKNSIRTYFKPPLSSFFCVKKTIRSILEQQFLLSSKKNRQARSM